MSEVIVNNWKLEEVNNEPTVRDIDLAERLGYERPRKIRELISRMIEADNFGFTLPYSKEESTGGRPAVVYYLNEKQALKVISKSETKKADQIMDEVIDVFLAYRNGKLQPKLDPKNFTMQAISQIANSFIELEQNFTKNINEVKNDIEELKDTSVLNSAECYKYQKSVHTKVEELSNRFPDVSKGSLYAQIHGAIKEKYQVASYKDLPRYKLNEVLEDVKNITVNIKVA